VDTPTVIILNGVGSVGKTSTAKAIQTIASAPFLHVQMDTFLEMLPPRMFGHPDGYIFETIDDGGSPSVAIHSGPVLERLMRGMRTAVAAMAAEGNNVVVDDVMFSGNEADDYRSVLGRFNLRFVALVAPLEVLEARERDRGDRDLGLARWQYDRVHRGIDYDLQLDTSLLTPREAAQTICQAFAL
jgi:chloramphenicol 3-O phosphotransferase